MFSANRFVLMLLSLHIAIVFSVFVSACRPVQAPLPVAGTTWTNPKDGATYVYVPAGPFLMGSLADDQMAFSNEQPQSTVETDGFWIMRTEVTNAQYKRCVEEKSCTALATTIWNNPDFAEYPLVNITWRQASDYAGWAGGRLPTEAEWEKACRGTDGRVFPWGSQAPTEGMVAMAPVADLSPAGSFPQDVSPYGVLDMAGSVMEWTSSKYDVYPYIADDGREEHIGDESRTSRGGSYIDIEREVRCASRTWTPPTETRANVGLRVVSLVR